MGSKRALCVAAAIGSVCLGFKLARADDTRVAPASKAKAFVTVRSSRSKAAPPNGFLKKGETAKLVEGGAEWLLVELDTGETGYVAADWAQVLLEIRPPRRIASADDVPAGSPAEGTFRIHMIDVGTGLAILVQGHDFSFLYDAGSKDKAETPERILSYLFAAIGPSGDASCVPSGDAWQAPATTLALDHVVLSHPHEDHGKMLDYVLHCYDVANIWDSGQVNDTVFYRQFVAAIAEESGATYHTALEPPANRKVPFKKSKSKPKWAKKSVKAKGGAVMIPDEVTWTQFADSQVVELGKDARFTILNATAEASDPNENSIVLLVELGGRRLLLTGDAVSGDRADPDDAIGANEKDLLERHPEQIDADILQAGHHGSMTSSRSEFIKAVSPEIALVSSGPTKYGRKPKHVVLPDKAVLKALKKAGATLLETYEHDKKCPEKDPIGPDKGPGGCDNYLIEIGSTQ